MTSDARPKVKLPDNNTAVLMNALVSLNSRAGPGAPAVLGNFTP